VKAEAVENVDCQSQIINHQKSQALAGGTSNVDIHQDG